MHEFIHSRRRFPELVKRYNLQDCERPNLVDIEIYSDKWSDDPRRIAVGWTTFGEQWDWKNPTLVFQAFEIPEGWADLFAHDDLHPESVPDDVLYYDAKFDSLLIEIDEAESIVPMAAFEGITFGSVNSIESRKIGRPKGTGYGSADEPIIEKMREDFRKNPSQTLRGLAERYSKEATGGGTASSKTKRLERRFRETL